MCTLYLLITKSLVSVHHQTADSLQHFALRLIPSFLVTSPLLCVSMWVFVFWFWFGLCIYFVFLFVFLNIP